MSRTRYYAKRKRSSSPRRRASERPRARPSEGSAALRKELDAVLALDLGLGPSGLGTAPFERPEDLRKPKHLRAFGLARDWLRRFAVRRRYFYTAASSYGYKHRAEWYFDDYIPNGALIAAAISLGYRHRRCRYDGTNAVFDLRVPREARMYGAWLREREVA